MSTVQAVLQTSLLQVGTNGIVSLGKPFYFWWPHYFPGYGWIRRRSVVAPFWADVDIRQDGNVWYQVYTEPEDLVLWRASRDVQKYVKEFSKFEAKWVLVATWDKVPNYPDGCTAYSWGWWWWWWSCYNDEYTGLVWSTHMHVTNFSLESIHFIL